MVQLCAAMESAEGDQFEDCLRALASLFSRGYTHLFMTQVLLMRKMMNHFTRLGKDLEVVLLLPRTAETTPRFKRECCSCCPLSQRSCSRTPTSITPSLASSSSPSSPSTSPTFALLPSGLRSWPCCRLSSKTSPASRSWSRSMVTINA